MKKKIINSIEKWFFFLICIMTITYIGSHIFIVLPALKRTVREKNKRDIEKLFSVTSQQFDYLASNIKDNAEWGMLYEVMKGSLNKEEKEKFFDDLFTEDSLRFFDLDYIAIYDNKQNEVINYSTPEKNIKNLILSKRMKYFFSTQPNGRNRVKMTSGYIDIKGKAYMFLSHIILYSDGKGKSAGSLLFIKEIDDDYIIDLEIKNNLILELYVPNKNDEELIKKILDSRKVIDYYSHRIGGKKRVYYVPYIKGPHKIAYIIKVIVDDQISEEVLLSFLTGLIPIFILILFVFFIKIKLYNQIVNPIVSLYKHIVLVKEHKIHKLFKYPEIGNELDEVIETFNDIMTETEDQKNALEKLAYTDHLTGLSTRRLLDIEYELLFENAKRSGNVLTLLMIDIDYFKKYNDKYGHHEGDQVLKIMGKLLKIIFKREGDVVSRYGGEEFLVVLYETSLKDIITLANKFQEKLKKCDIKHEDSSFGRVTVSMGIKSNKIMKHQDSHFFFKEVDNALYKAKSSGRNKYIFEF